MRGASLEIEKADLSEADIELSETSYTYDGTEKKPTVTVTYNKNVLVEGTDYTVTYEDDINAGTAKACVNAVSEGNFKGQAYASYEIKSVTTDQQDATDQQGTTGQQTTINQQQTSGSGDTQIVNVLPVGTIIRHTKSNDVYKVTKAGNVKNGKVTGAEVSFVRPIVKKTSATIPAKITSDGVTYKVTSVAAKAFKNNKKLKTVKIGKYVKKIGTSAFANCKELKKITISSTKLKKIGKKAFSGINKNAVIKVKKKHYKKYKKYFKSNAGYKTTMKIKKYR